MLQGVLAQFAAVSAHLVAAEGGGGIEDIVAVDPDGAGAQAVGDAVRLGDVAGPDGGGQAEMGLVAAFHHLVGVLEREHVHHWAENFVAGDFHLILDVVEDRRLDEVALVADAITAAQHLGAFLLARVDEAHDAIHLLLRDLRALLGGGVERVAYFPRLGLLEELVDHLVVDLFFHEQAATGAATLALVEEQAEVGALDGGVEVGVGEDDVRALAAQLEADTFEVALGGGLRNDLAGGVLAGKGDLVDILVAGEGGAGGGAEAGHHVDDAVGEADLLSQTRHAQGG